MNIAVSATSGCDWTVSEGLSWITIESGARGSGNGVVTLKADVNTQTSSRSGTVTVAGMSFSVSQAGVSSSSCSTVSISPNGVGFPEYGGGQTVWVDMSSSYCPWSASENLPWVSLSSSDEAGDGTVVVRADPNTSSSPRSGNVSVAGKTFLVEQAGASACSFAISPASMTFPSTGGDMVVAISASSASCSWSASEELPWITLSRASGVGQGRLIISASENKSSEARMGTVIIGGKSVSISQSGYTCSLLVTPNSKDFPSVGGDCDLYINVSNPLCPWSVSENLSWITLSKYSGYGDTHIKMTASPNTATTSRSSSFQISDKTIDVSQAGVSNDYKLKWYVETGSSISSTPAIAPDGSVVVGSINGKVYSFSPSGNKSWELLVTGGDELWHGVSSSPSVGSRGAVYVGSDDGVMHAINSDGSKLWSYETTIFNDEPIKSSSAVSSDSVYVGGMNGVLYCFSLTGVLRWSYDTESYIETSPAIDLEGNVYISARNTLYSFTSSGTLRWKVNVGHNISASPTVSSDNTIYVVASTNQWYDSKLFALKTTGEHLWNVKIGDLESKSSPSICLDGNIVVGSSDGNVYSIDKSGIIDWKYKTTREINSSPAVGSDGTIYVTSDKLYAINPKGSIKWDFILDRYSDSSPVIDSSGIVYVATSGGNLYAIDDYSIEGPASTSWPLFRSNPAHTGIAVKAKEKCTYSVTPLTTSVGAAGGSVNFLLAANSALCTWKASESSPWISLSQTSGSGETTIKATVVENTLSTARSATITIAGQSVTISQSGATQVCSYSISPTSTSFSSSEGRVNLFLDTSGPTCPWSASEALPWASLSQSSGSGDASIVLSVTGNTSTSPRSGNITVAGKNISVLQVGMSTACSYSIAPTSESFSAAGGSVNVSVDASSSVCSWSSSESLSWISLSHENGAGDGVVTITATENTSTAARSGSVIIAGRTFSVTQAGASSPCTFSITPTSHDFPVIGGDISVAIDASSSSCSWNTSSIPSWLTLSKSSGTGDQNLTITASENADAVSRFASVSIGGRSFSATQTGVDVKTLTSLNISAPTTVQVGSQIELSASAQWSDGSATKITPIWSENSSYCTISNGKLVVNEGAGGSTISVTAQYSYGGVTKNDSIAITIAEPGSTSKKMIPIAALSLLLLDGDLDDGIVYKEDFSSDPKFTSLSSVHAYWDSEAGNYCVRTRDNLSYKYWAYKKIPLVEASKNTVQVNFDVMFECQDWGTYPGVRFYATEPVDISTPATFVLYNAYADGVYKKNRHLWWS